MYLVLLNNFKDEEDCDRWVCLSKNTFLIKQLNDKEYDRIKNDINVVEFYKVNKNNLTIIKSLQNKILEGLTL
jgi:hypothetical protein